MDKTKQRLSNIELLRLVAMFLIVLTHANFFSLGRPKMPNLFGLLSVSACRVSLTSVLICLS